MSKCDQTYFSQETVPGASLSQCSLHSLISLLLNAPASAPSPKCLFPPYFLPVVLAALTPKALGQAYKD